MTGKMAYLAEPIDQYQHPGGEASAIRLVLEQAGWIIYSPRLAWRVGEGAEPSPVVETINRGALSHARLLVAYLPDRVPTIGVPREIEAAVMRSIPVIVVGQNARQRFALQDVVCVSGAQELEGYLSNPPPYPDPKPVVQRWLTATEMESIRPFEQAPYPDPTPVARAWVDAQVPDDRLGEHILGYELEYLQLPYATGTKWDPLATNRSYPSDAGFDLYTAQHVEIEPGAYGRVPCGVKIALPEGVFGWVVARSSTFRDYGLIVLPGIIDTGYRGELEAVVWNTESYQVSVKPGDRIAQLVLLPNLVQHTRLKKVSRLRPGDRGDNGFGSSNAAKADRLCLAGYVRPGGPQRGDRIVRCGLKYGHAGDHVEDETGASWRNETPIYDDRGTD